MNETASSEISGGEGGDELPVDATSVCRSRPVGAADEVVGVPLPDSDPKTKLMEIIMWFGLGIIGLIVCAAIALWPARVAARKGHSFIERFDGESIPEGGTR